MKMLARMALLASLVVVAPRPALAQFTSLAEEAKPGFISVGALVGAELDHADHWLTLGLDSRIGVAKPAVELVPRFTYRALEDGSETQFDVNVLRNIDLARPGRFRPFAGIGAAVNRLGSDGAATDTRMGLNLVSGVRIAMRSGAAYEPFISAQYTIFRSRPDGFALVGGASFSLH